MSCSYEILNSELPATNQYLVKAMGDYCYHFSKYSLKLAFSLSYCRVSLGIFKLKIVEKYKTY